MTITNPWLMIAGGLSAAAALAHLAVIAGGPRWYAFFGAGRRMVRLAEQGSPTATLITLAIVTVLSVWSAYAFSGAGVLPKLPLLKLGLLAITAIYLTRAVVFVPVVMAQTGQAGAFAWWSSAIVLVFGVVHAVGTWILWRT